MTIPEWFTNLDIGARVAKEERQKRLAERQEHVDAIAALEKQALVEAKKLAADCEAKLKVYEKAELAAQEAAAQYNKARNCGLAASLTRTSTRNGHEAALRSTADPKLVELIHEASGLRGSIRHQHDAAELMPKIREAVKVAEAAIFTADDSAAIGALRKIVKKGNKAERAVAPA